MFLISLVALLMAVPTVSLDYVEWRGDKTTPMPEFMVRNISSHVKLAKLLALAVITRIDRVPALTSNAKKNHYYWAWHASECNGLGDRKWSKSNGYDFFKAIQGDHDRLQKNKIITPTSNHRGGVAIDIGAHTGDSTIPMAQLADLTIAFDPSDTMFPILKANSLLNPHLNIKAYNLAVSNQTGKQMACYNTVIINN